MIVDEDAIFQLADKGKQKPCKSCGTRGIREPYMQGTKKHESGSKTVVNCTSCYSGQGKQAIPVTNVDTSDVRLVNEIYNDPGVCNNPTSTLISIHQIHLILAGENQDGIRVHRRHHVFRRC